MRKPTSASTMVTADEAPNCLIRFSHHLPKLQIRAYPVCCCTFFHVQLSTCSTLECIQVGQSAKTWSSSNELHRAKRDPHDEIVHLEERIDALVGATGFDPGAHPPATSMHETPRRRSH